MFRSEISENLFLVTDFIEFLEHPGDFASMSIDERDMWWSIYYAVKYYRGKLNKMQRAYNDIREFVIPLNNSRRDKLLHSAHRFMIYLYYA